MLKITKVNITCISCHKNEKLSNSCEIVKLRKAWWHAKFYSTERTTFTWIASNLSRIAHHLYNRKEEQTFFQDIHWWAHEEHVNSYQIADVNAGCECGSKRWARFSNYQPPELLSEARPIYQGMLVMQWSLILLFQINAIV